MLLIRHQLNGQHPSHCLQLHSSVDLCHTSQHQRCPSTKFQHCLPPHQSHQLVQQCDTRPGYSYQADAGSCCRNQTTAQQRSPPRHSCKADAGSCSSSQTTAQQPSPPGCPLLQVRQELDRRLLLKQLFDALLDCVAHVEAAEQEAPVRKRSGRVHSCQLLSPPAAQEHSWGACSIAMQWHRVCQLLTLTHKLAVKAMAFSVGGRDMEVGSLPPRRARFYCQFMAVHASGPAAVLVCQRP